MSLCRERQGRSEAPPGAELAAEGVGCARSSIRDGWAQQEFPNLNHVARGLVLGETPLEGVTVMSSASVASLRALASLRAPLGVSQRTRHYLASRLNSSRKNSSGLLRRRRGTDYRPDCETNCSCETPSQRQTLDHL